MDTRASTAAPNSPEMWTVRGLLARHRRAALVAAASLAVLVAMFLVAVFGSKEVTSVSDATTCSEWSSANQAQQTAYARLYFREHGPLRSGATSPASIIAAINSGCIQAYGEDVSDTATVVQAISGNF